MTIQVFPQIAHDLGIDENWIAAVSGIFQDMEMVEEEIAAAGGDRDGDLVARTIWHAFRLFQRPRYIQNDEVYRAYIRELLGRIKAVLDGDVDVTLAAPTDVERVTVISEASLHANLVLPLQAYGLWLFNRIAGRVDGLPTFDSGVAEGLFLTDEIIKPVEKQALKLAQTDPAWEWRQKWDKVSPIARAMGEWIRD